MLPAEDRIVVGCIADDFTGASDIGSFFVKGGFNTLLINGIPGMDFDPGESIEALVIALKTRSIEKEKAVAQSLKALYYLKGIGCRQIYFKYCSTFDSTPEGNIGPVADALMDKTNSPYTVLCPSLPVNGRRVKDGELFVNGLPLHESPMKDHPVTPMWDHKLAQLMRPQSSYPCMEISANDLRKGKERVDSLINQFAESVEGKAFYVIPDYFEDWHGASIAEFFADLPLITGGSGLAEHLAAFHKKRNPYNSSHAERLPTGTRGRSIIFAGSCSTATQEQVRVYKEGGGTSIELNALELKDDASYIFNLMKKVKDPASTDILIHTSGNSDKEDRNQSTGLSQNEISGFYESAMAELAAAALEAGIHRIIIAGGETSGAVTEKLGFQSFILCDPVAPGVPVLIPVQNKSVRLVLKSGNFGRPDFFTKALAKTLEG
ncbi:MAG: 3-oxo-tetronate kinase [Bacteroidales bacterium]